MEVKLKLVNGGKMPYKATAGAAGYDLYAWRVEDLEDRIICYTGVSIQLPPQHGGLIMPRSSVVKSGLFMGNSVGLIDSDYTGEIKVVFYKRDNCTAYKVGDRVAQLVIVPVPDVEFIQVDELSETERGAGGYGSTGN